MRLIDCWKHFRRSISWLTHSPVLFCVPLLLSTPLLSTLLCLYLMCCTMSCAALWSSAAPWASLPSALSLWLFLFSTSVGRKRANKWLYVASTVVQKTYNGWNMPKLYGTYRDTKKAILACKPPSNVYDDTFQGQNATFWAMPPSKAVTPGRIRIRISLSCCFDFGHVFSSFFCII